MQPYHKGGNQRSNWSSGEPLNALQNAPGTKVSVFGSSLSAWSFVNWVDYHAAPYYTNQGVTFYNNSASGNDSQDGLARIDADLAAQSPDLVVLEYAINDSGGADTVANSLSELDQLLAKVWAHNAALQVVLMTPTRPVDAGYSARAILKDVIQGWRDKAASDARIFLADVFAVFEPIFEQKESYYRTNVIQDTVHPTNLGGHMMFQVFQNIFERGN